MHRCGVSSALLHSTSSHIPQIGNSPVYFIESFGLIEWHRNTPKPPNWAPLNGLSFDDLKASEWVEKGVLRRQGLFCNQRVVGIEPDESSAEHFLSMPWVALLLLHAPFSFYFCRMNIRGISYYPQHICCLLFGCRQASQTAV